MSSRFSGRSVHRVTPGLAALLALTGGAAYAQSESTASAAVEEIVVTGSRILRDGITAPTPVTVVGSERIENLGATNIGQVLNTLPSFRASSNPSTANIQPRAAGTSLADLRGLGPTRTLVLVNGRRFVPSTLEGSVDLNQIPTLLLERSEVVTGGASAAYGSDAVAGVVNLILKQDLEGVRTQLQYGRTEEGDGEDYVLGIAGGTSFADDRGHITAGFEYEDNKGTAGCYARDWCAQEYQVITNLSANAVPATATSPAIPAIPKRAGLPANNILPFSHTVTAVTGGLITNGPLMGTAFRPDGTPYQYQFGTVFPNNSTFMAGGDGDNGFIGAPLMVVPVERYTGILQSTFDFTETTQSTFEFSYGRVEAQGRGAQTRDTGPTPGAGPYPGGFGGPVPGAAIVIRGDNAYLPQSLRTALLNAGLPLTSTTSFALGRMGDDFGYTENTSTTEVYRALVGLNGQVGGSWTWDVYYQYGETSYEQIIQNNRITQQVPGVPNSGACSATNSSGCARIQLAADAVVNPATGQIVCRSTLTNPNNGCQPANLFGYGRYSAAAKAYLYGTATSGIDFEQHVVAANVQGDLFDNWAGAVPLALGVEYRNNDVSSSADPISATSGFYVFNSSIVKGDIEVKEAYAETAVPLLANQAWANSLELNGAVRLTDYSTSGEVTTWKYGVVYEPLDWLRLRATKSRDIRAPNTDELFRPATTGFQTVNGILTPTVSGGNSTLVEEAADTFTVGVAFRPTGWLDGFRASIDYYEIDIEDAIQAPTAQSLVNSCVRYTVFCDRVTLNPNGSVAQVRTVFLNYSRLENSGLDIELNYRFPVGGGSLDLGVLATRLYHLRTTESSGITVERAGVTGNNVSGGGAGMPKWQLNGMVTYSTGPLTLTFEGRYIDSGLFDATLIGPEQGGYNVNLPNSINTNHVDSRFYANLGARYRLTAPKNNGVELFAGIQNVFDKDPPVAPSNQGSTNQILFDPLGRAYRVGVRIDF